MVQGLVQDLQMGSAGVQIIPAEGVTCKAANQDVADVVACSTAMGQGSTVPGVQSAGRVREVVSFSRRAAGGFVGSPPKNFKHWDL